MPEREERMGGLISNPDRDAEDCHGQRRATVDHHGRTAWVKKVSPRMMARLMGLPRHVQDPGRKLGAVEDRIRGATASLIENNLYIEYAITRPDMRGQGIVLGLPSPTVTPRPVADLGEQIPGSEGRAYKTDFGRCERERRRALPRQRCWTPSSR